MTDILVSTAIIVLLILFGGLFVASEIALVSLRESQIKAMTGRRGRRVARLAESPNRFLATVQLVVTAAGFLSAAFGEARLSHHLRPVLEDAGLSGGLADVLSLILITLLISYFAITAGELVPKRLALQRPERTALFLAPLVDRSARISRPAIWLLSRSTDVFVRLLGGDPTAGREAITEEELRGLVASHESLTKDERKLIDEVFAAGTMQVREVMVPRTEVAFLDAGMTVSRAMKEAQVQPHSRYPVVRGSSDDIIGFLHVRDLMAASLRRNGKVGEIAREVKMLPSTKPVLSALSEMRREGAHLAVVIDEYGGTAGIVTLEDLIEEVIGDIRDEYDLGDDAARTLRGGDVEVDGLLNIEDFAEETGIELPEGPYETVAGYILKVLGHLPAVGDEVEAGGARLRVSSLDGRRVDRVRVTPLEPEDGPGA
jgi:putative hemolysin